MSMYVEIEVHYPKVEASRETPKSLNDTNFSSICRFSSEMKINKAGINE